MDQQSLSFGLLFILLSAILELCVYFLDSFWNKRRVVAAISLLFLSFGAGIVAVGSWLPLALLVCVISIYKGFSLLRLVEGRTSAERLRAAGRESYLWLTGALVVLYLLGSFVPISAAQLGLLVAFGSVLLSGMFALGAVSNLVVSKPDVGAPLSDKELPTVTIAIPARNETDSLEACLIAALASDYPKLEIIVLDDCSQDKTAEVIKSFAHEGVRFVLGEVNPEDWLAKNYAYRQLLSEASGEYVLFMGVDIRLHSTSVRSLIQMMKQNKQTMVSVLPRRTKAGLAASFVQSMRYFWELAIPRRLKKWPPVLSSCWIIDRKAAQKLGGFEAVKRAILPERHFARDLGANYAFKRTSLDSVITTHKDFRSQWNTAIRTRYPQLHRRPELVAMQTIGLTLLVLCPFILIFTATSTTAKIACAFAALLYTLTHVAITAFTNKSALWLSPFTIFFTVIFDLIALNISMYLYEFSEVMWKGRNVCVPVMKIVPRLPKL